MKLQTLIPLLAIAFLSAPLHADSNATGGNTVASESLTLGGVFDHAGAVGDNANSITSGTFVGGFTANQVTFSGTLTSLAAATRAIEADIVITDPAGATSLTWQNPGPDSTFSTFNYTATQDLTGAYAGGINPAGTWNIEFIDTFPDNSGADAQSSNVTMTFEEVTPVADTNGNFALNSLGIGDTDNEVGEAAVEAIFDLYDITLNVDGFFQFRTFEDTAGGFTGSNLDTEIAIFDSSGTLLGQDDDSGADTFSDLGLDLLAGDYTLAVAGFNSSFDDGFIVNAGNGVGDYALSVSLTSVPEPASLGLLGLLAAGMLTCRRRRK